MWLTKCSGSMGNCVTPCLMSETREINLKWAINLRQKDFPCMSPDCLLNVSCPQILRKRQEGKENVLINEPQHYYFLSELLDSWLVNAHPRAGIQYLWLFLFSHFSLQVTWLSPRCSASDHRGICYAPSRSVVFNLLKIYIYIYSVLIADKNHPYPCHIWFGPQQLIPADFWSVPQSAGTTQVAHKSTTMPQYPAELGSKLVFTEVLERLNVYIL